MTGLLLLAALVAAGLLGRLSARRLLAALAGLWLSIMLLTGLLPDSAPARLIGGSVRQWAIGGGLLALVLGYRALLATLRAHARAPLTRAPLPPASRPEAGMPPALSDDELARYARHLVLRDIGGPGQMRLAAARVLVVGAGGLGAPLCLYLAAAGVGRITLADDDRVDPSNLQRQVIFRDDQRGALKAEAAAAAMTALNPHCRVTALPRRILAGDEALVAAHDLVIEGTDSFAARAAINRICVAARVPLLSGAIGQWEGQVTLYDPARGGPCLACLFPVPPAAGLAPPCAEAGVVGALPGVIGSLLALEAIKHLTGAGTGLRGRMMLFDGLQADSRMIATAAHPGCEICGAVQESPQL